MAGRQKLTLWLGIIVVVYAIFHFEWLIVEPSGASRVTYYNELADAFLAGQTYLSRAPAPEMMALPDPWDPAANLKFRTGTEGQGPHYNGVHDLTLYDGKFYLEWGPLPALVLIPLRWLGGHDLPMGHLVLVVETIAALTYAAAVLKMVRWTALGQTRPMTLFVIVTVLLCPIWTFSLCRISVYETSIYFGQLCVSLALLSAVSAFADDRVEGRKRLWLLCLSSALLGCAVNCRLDLALLGVMVPVIWLGWSRVDLRARKWRPAIISALAIGGPAALLLGCALAYNYVRFGNIFEVGQTWQLWAGNESLWQHKFKFIEAGRILPNIWYYLLAPVTVSSQYPILITATLVPPHSWMSPEQLAVYGDYIDRTSGLFVVTPVAGLAVLAPLLFLRRSSGGTSGRLRWVVAILMLSAFFGGILPFLTAGVMRYAMEWCMWWVMAGIMVAYWIRGQLRVREWRWGAALFDLGLTLSAGWSCWVGASYLLTGG